MNGSIKQALKEWNIAVQALEQGKTILLLRKGGIREQKGNFYVPHRRILLYPTFEHQQPDLLLPEYASQVQPVSSGWHPQTVQISSWADITEILPLETSKAETLISEFLPFLIWNEKFVRDRLKFKPEKPLFLLLLKPYRLPDVYELPYDSSYGGCRSWIELKESISLENSQEVFEESDYQRLCVKIHKIVQD